MNPVSGNHGASTAERVFEVVSNNVGRVEIIQDISGLYRLIDLPIFGKRPEDCVQMYEALQKLGQKGEFGELIKDYMMKHLKSNRLHMVGFPADVLPHDAGSVPARGKYFPSTTGGKTAILVALDQIPVARQITFNHEAVHFFVHNITVDHSADPISHLPKEFRERFLDIVKSEYANFAKNPYRPGSREWSVHKHLFENIFEMPLCYPANQRIAELTAYALQFELTFEGGVLRKHCPRLADGLRQVIIDAHDLPLPRTLNQPHCLNRNLNIPDHLQTVSLNDLKIKNPNTPLNQVLKTIGLATEKAFAKGVQFGLRAFEAAGRPCVALPVDIVFAFDGKQQNALLKAIINGTATWHLGTLMYRAVALAGTVPVIVISVGCFAAEVLPDMNAKADKLPTSEEISRLANYDPSLEMLLHTVYGRQKAFLNTCGWVQKGFQAINPVRFWNRSMRKNVDQSIDDCFDFEEIVIDGVFTKTENNLAKLEKMLSDHFDGYIPQYLPPVSINNNNNQVSDQRGDFEPNLDTLVPSAVDAWPTNSHVNLTQLDACALPWTVNRNGEAQVTSLQTYTEMSAPELEALTNLAQTLEVPVISNDLPTPPNRVLLHSVNTPAPERPSFSELSRITDVRLGEGIGGGQGIVFTLESGARFSISTTGRDIRTGVRVPMAKGFLTALATGLRYTAPIAAALVAYNMLFMRKDKSAYDPRKEEKAAQKLADKIDRSRENFDRFLGQFQRNEIDKQTFINLANQIVDYIHRTGDKSAFKSFFDITSIKQIDLDLKRLTENAFARREVNENFAPEIKGKPVKDLVNDLMRFSNKKVLTLQEKYQQEALKNELLVRVQTGNLDELQHIESLATHPVAIALDPEGVAKPKFLKEKYYAGGESEAGRRKERVKKWSSNLEDAYSRFEEHAKNGNVAEMEKAAHEVYHQLERADGDHDVNLKDYGLYNCYSSGDYYKNAYEYYKNYMATIKSKMEQTLARSHAVKSGTVSEENPAYFTPTEIKKWKKQAASNTFNEAVIVFNSPTAATAEKDAAFQKMFGAAKILNENGEKNDPQIQNVITIGNQYSSYSQFQAVVKRQEDIRSNLQGLQDARKQMEESPVVPPEEYQRLYKLANEHAEKLIELRVTEEDIHQLTDKNTDGQEVVSWIHRLPAIYKHDQIEFAKRKSTYTSLEAFEKIREQMGLENIKKKEYARLYKEAFDAANKMIEGGLSEAEIRKITLTDEDAKDRMIRIQAIREGYPNFLRVGEYQDRTLHLFSTPMSRLALHVLNDFSRFDRPMMQFGVKILSTANSMAPGVVPAGINRLVAGVWKENAAVTHELSQNCFKALKSNVVSSLIQDASDPKGLLQKSFNKKATAIQGANVVVQVLATGVTACVSKVFTDDAKAQKVNLVISDVALGVNTAANAVYYANVLQKTHKYVKLGKLGLKFHKVGQGLFGLATTLSFDIGEFLATDPSEWNRGQEFIKTVQSYLPNFRGNLPESVEYYTAKDFLVVAGCALLGANPVTLGLGLFQGAAMLYNAYSDKYVDDALTAIMINLRYFSKQSPTKEIKESIEKSVKNLEMYIDHSVKILDSDSKVKQRGKVLAFEYRLVKYQQGKHWFLIKHETEFEFKEPDSCKFKESNIEVFDVISSVFKRYEAIAEMMRVVSTYPITDIRKSLVEINNLLEYTEKCYQKLSKANKEKMSEYIQDVKASFESIRTLFLKNFLVFYVKGQREVSPWVALDGFDRISKKERGVQEWYSLGVICGEFYKENKILGLLELSLFCFETVYGCIVLAEKKGKELDDFEIELKGISKKVIGLLNGGLSGSREYSEDTVHFTPVIQKILDDSKKKGKEELC